MSDTDGTAGRFTPLLAPLGWLYAAGVGARCALYDRRWFHTHRLAGPVLSVGNLTVGGTGKTPLVIFLAEMLQKAGRAPSILTRGYRRRPAPSWVVVEPGSGRQGGAAELGDEPALMARRLPQVPIVVSADRYGAGRVAESRFQVGVHLLDDGFQHLRLHRDLNLLVLDATQPFRTGRLLPGGRLRERPAAARRADLIVITRGNPDSTFRLKAELEELGIRCPTFSAQTRLRDMVPAQPAEESPPSTPDVTHARSALAFCGVGNPAAFFADLDRWGFTVADRIAFRDHHRYSESDCRQLIRQARKSRAEILLTTEKDQLNLPDGISWEIPLYVCCIDLEVSDEDRFNKYVLECPRAGEPGKIMNPENALASPRKLMVRAPNWVGDVVISLPALQVLRERYPTAEVLVVAKPWVADIYRSQPWISGVIVYDPVEKHRGYRGLLNLIRSLRQEHFDVAILLQNAFQAAWMARQARIPVRIGYASDGRGFLLTHPLPVPSATAIGHQAYYYLNLLWRTGIIHERGPAPEPSMVLPDRVMNLAGERLKREGVDRSRLILGLQPGAAFGPAKRWLPERFAALADRYAERWGAQILLFGSAKERGLVESICRQMHSQPVNLAGATTLLEFMALLKNCQAFVANDSGPMHLAAALEVPLVALFGSTDERATGPLGSRIAIVKVPVECSPCLRRTCPIDFRCMKNLTVDMAFAAVGSRLKAFPG